MWDVNQVQYVSDEMGFIVYDKNDQKPTAQSIDTFGPYFVEQCVAAHAQQDICHENSPV